jgi:hypothetical protein
MLRDIFVRATGPEHEDHERRVTQSEPQWLHDSSTSIAYIVLSTTPYACLPVSS